MTSGDCESNGYSYITTKDECAIAGKILQVTNADDNPRASGNRQKYCGTWAGNTWMHFNSQTTGKGSNGYAILQTADSNAKQICKIGMKFL